VSDQVVVIHGPNLNLLGEREPEVYGSETLDSINGAIQAAAARLGVQVFTHQSNSESELIELVQKYRKGVRGIIINPGGFSHTSVALLDALTACEVPIVEVHLSSPFRREDFRHKLVTAGAATGMICGLGSRGYLFALEYLTQRGSTKTIRP
jgi:3-dehydroquinate dehydratase-2